MSRVYSALSDFYGNNAETEQDFADAEFVARRYGVTNQKIQAAADAALAASPKDTALFVFRKAVALFLQRLE